MSLASFRALREGHEYAPFQRSAWEVAEANRRFAFLSEREPTPVERWEGADEHEWTDEAEAACVAGAELRQRCDELAIQDNGD